ncbi:erythrose-4-phosphate dehydrogenase, partial [Neisseria sp. P0001.S008]
IINLDCGEKKVLFSSPGGDYVDASIVYGVNDDVFTDDMNVIYNASCTTNCLAPVGKVLNVNMGIVNGVLSTIQALTNVQSVTDVRQKD